MTHTHDHHHDSTVDFNRAFAIGTALNLVFVLVEAACGTMANSLALIADAGHNLSDVMTLLLAWAAMTIAKRSATARHTFGFKNATILASFASALFLCVALGVIVWEAVGRLQTPEPVSGKTISLVAAAGVVINTATALLFLAGRKKDLNIKAAFLHMAGDAAVSAGVMVSGLIIAATGWVMLDPIVSISISLMIFLSGWGLLRDSLHLTMAGVPSHIDAESVLNYLTELPEVQYVHDLHIWAASTTENVLTAHLIMQSGGSDEFLHKTAEDLHRRFNIHHTTIQIERSDISGICHTEDATGRGRCWPGRLSESHNAQSQTNPARDATSRCT